MFEIDILKIVVLDQSGFELCIWLYSNIFVLDQNFCA